MDAMTVDKLEGTTALIGVELLEAPLYQSMVSDYGPPEKPFEGVALPVPGAVSFEDMA